MSEILSNKEITRVVRNMDCAEVRPFDIEFARAIERAVMQKLWEPVALPFAILDEELQDLHRFHECASDGEGYDVPKERMKRLAEIGLLRRVTANIYEHTTFGLSVINGDFTHPAPIPEGWISVNDRLPKVGRTPILVAVSWVKYGEHEDGTPTEATGVAVTEGEYVPAHGEAGGYFDSYQGSHGDSQYITHWQPLPAPPMAAARSEMAKEKQNAD